MSLGVDYTSGVGYIGCAGNSSDHPLNLQNSTIIRKEAIQLSKYSRDIRGMQMGFGSQHSNVNVSTNSAGTITFPTPFPAGASIMVFCNTVGGSRYYGYTIFSSATSSTGFTWNKCAFISTGGQPFNNTEDFCWLAICL
jgi:hypothetical protein